MKPEQTKTIIDGVTVETVANTCVELINVQTGAVEQLVQTGHRITLTYNKHSIITTFSANYYDNGSTSIQTNVYLSLANDIVVDDIIKIITVYKDIVALNKDSYNNISCNDLNAQARQRTRIHEQVIKEEEKYKRKILNEEIKRLARENVDAYRPPLTSMLPIAIEAPNEDL